ncbi:hypothetical protein [Aureimonas leprariae]|uniref:Uncharacterized protein n=1 Tax=Plantimonas leprariae TaxID=2615207 RepID=A0A7V7PPX0_9HYPH|nr:hypothetical protein [Aureimonas leprariae]KAB0680090.1 hypothetical protein F6X38_09785 [Aureimonas leprariae]
MLNRRRFIATAVPATATAALGVRVALSAEQADTAKLDALLVAYMAEAKEARRLGAAWDAATAALPEWARSGPEFLSWDGTKCGDKVPWPEVAELPDPSGQRGVYRRIRPSLRKIWEDAQHPMFMPGPTSVRYSPEHKDLRQLPATEFDKLRRRRARLETFKRMRVLIARLREQKAERAKVGLPMIGKALDDNYDRRWAIRETIMAEASGTSPQDIAVLALFEYHDEGDRFPRDLLRRLVPSLTGLLRTVVDDMLAHEWGDDANTLLQGGPGGLA